MDPVNEIPPAPEPSGSTPTDETIARAAGIAASSHPELFPAPEAPQSAPPVVDPPKRGRGRPPGSKTRAKVESTDTSNIVEQNFAPVDSPFDESALETLVEGGIEAVTDITGFLAEMWVGKKTKNPAKLRSARETKVIGDNARNLMKTGGIGCIKKFAPGFKAEPEWILSAGFGLYLSSVAAQCKLIIDSEDTP